MISAVSMLEVIVSVAKAFLYNISLAIIIFSIANPEKATISMSNKLHISVLFFCL